MMEKFAYSLDEVVQASGYGRTTVDNAIRRGSLVAHYENTKPVVLAKDLTEWLESLPTEKPKARS